MFESMKKKEERKEEKERKKPPKHRFKFICVFNEYDVRREGEFIAVKSELENVLAAKKINFMYGVGIQGLRRNAVISTSMKGSQILSVRVKELNRHIFFVGHIFQASSLPEHMG